MKKSLTILLFITLITLLFSSCKTSYNTAWQDGVYDKERGADAYWCAVGTGIDEMRAIGDAANKLQREIQAELGNDIDTPFVIVEPKTTRAGVVITDTDNITFKFFVNTYNSEQTKDGKTIVRIGFEKKEFEKQLEVAFDKFYSDAEYVYKHYKMEGKAPLVRIPMLQKAEKQSRLADQCAKLLKLFNGRNYNTYTALISTTIKEEASHLTIKVTADDVHTQYKDEMVAAVKSKLIALGYQVKEKADHELKISYVQTLAPKTEGIPYSYIYYTFATELLYNKLTVISFSVTDRIAAINDSEAEAKARQLTVVEIPNQLFFSLSNF